MPVSGLVVSLTEDPCLRQEAVAAIRADPRLEVGYLRARRMAVVMDTQSSDEDKQLWNWLTDLPGVLFVDVTLIGFEGDSTSEANDEPGDAVEATGFPLAPNHERHAAILRDKSVADEVIATEVDSIPLSRDKKTLEKDGLPDGC